MSLIFFVVFINCRTTSGSAPSGEFTENGLVRDGTPCGTNLICVNQTCVSLFPYIDQTKCPTNSNNVECYGQGVREITILLKTEFELQICYKEAELWLLKTDAFQHDCVCWCSFSVSFQRFAPIRIDAFAIRDLLVLIVQLLCP